MGFAAVATVQAERSECPAHSWQCDVRLNKYSLNKQLASQETQPQAPAPWEVLSLISTKGA